LAKWAGPSWDGKYENNQIGSKNETMTAAQPEARHGAPRSLIGADVLRGSMFPGIALITPVVENGVA
jgi:hypothetical protein